MQKSELRTILADQLTDLLRQDSAEIIRDNALDSQHEFPEISVVTGVRRCGKSTALCQLARRLHENKTGPIHYLNFEDQRLSLFHVDDFQRAYEEFLLNSPTSDRQTLIYDEIQLVDGWERWIAGLSSKKNLKVYITGSNSKLLSSELASLLTGRYQLLHVTPLSFAEIISNLSDPILTDPTLRDSTAAKIIRIRAFEEFLQFGGFPRAFLSKSIAILGQYYQDIVEKDIALRRGVRNISALKKLGSVLASQNGRLLNQSAVTRDLGVKSLVTISKFCDYFAETYLYAELRLYSRSRRIQLRGHAKYYAVDPLMALQTGYFPSAGTSYWILENHVCTELLRRGFELSYWHSQRKLEVDFIAQKKGQDPIAVQVAYDLSTPTTLARECGALDAACAELGIKRALIISATEPDEHTRAAARYPIVPFYDWAINLERDSSA